SVPALIALITVDHADGRRETFATDTTWKTHAGMWQKGPPRNDEGDFVEIIDNRLESPGWDQPGFDDGDWPPAAALGSHPTPPFLHLHPQRTHIVESRADPVKFTRLGNAYVVDLGAVLSATPVVHVHHGVNGHRVTLVGGFELDADQHVSRRR